MASPSRSYIKDETGEDIRREILAGLAQPQKTIPGKYLWDERGSQLFERICGSDAYYLNRTERALLERHADTVAGIVGERASLIEFGSGSSAKTGRVLRALRPLRYVPLDISAAFLAQSAARLAAEFPAVAVTPVIADYTRPIRLAPALLRPPVLGLFLGSTIGNFAPPGVIGFLQRAGETLGRSRLLLGVDATMAEAALTVAYRDGDGLMAALHTNILLRLNRELDGDIDPANFRHDIRIRRNPARVEAHIVAQGPARYRLAGETISFAAGETIHTDTSYKMPPADFAALAAAAGWEVEARWQDATVPDYSLFLLRHP